MYFKNLFSICILFFMIGMMNIVNAQYQQPFREFKVLDSKFISKDQIFKNIKSNVASFDKYEKMAPFVLEKSIPEIQDAVYMGYFNYQDLCLFYLTRIYNYDRENDKSLNSVISINPNALEMAKQLDRNYLNKMNATERKKLRYSVYGMPILVKDNIDVGGMITTAGSVILSKNKADSNAVIVDNLMGNSAVILGKTNLSEWAYFFCGDCPSGYSAVGGQTLNPYGRKSIDTGGSSSGSGVAVAANFAVAAIGTETAGSIISPSAQNSIVGLKPSFVMGEGGIVPISNDLDRSGPMTKFVIDNFIVMKAAASANYEFTADELVSAKLENTGKKLRLGVYESYLENELYRNAIDRLQSSGFTIVKLKPKSRKLPDFLKLLTADMKRDLHEYISLQTDLLDGVTSSDHDATKYITAFNRKDSINYMPYGQRLFNGIVADTTTDEELSSIRKNLNEISTTYFSDDLKTNQLDAILSINNYDAGMAAVGYYPIMTVPMGYDKETPYGLSFITDRGMEVKLYQVAMFFERLSHHRRMPKGYE